jgi:hypothetical protein
METSMADIVVMNLWRDQNGRRWQTRQSSQEETLPGEVVLFTGVRYERFDDRMDRKAENHAVRFEQN